VPGWARRVGGSLLAGAALVVGVAACTTADDAATTPPPISDPTGATTEPPAGAPGRSVVPATWSTASPVEAGLDPTVLDDLAAEAERAGSSCLVVVRDGRLVGEWYSGGTTSGTTRPIWSITKSITSLLAGMATADGRLSLDAPAADAVPEWAGTPAAAVTVRDLLAQVSGRGVPPGEIERLFAAPDQSAHAVAQPQAAPPGTTWAYGNASVQALEPVLDAAVGDVGTYAEGRLFGPLGMGDTELARDASGNPLLYAWATSTCRDVARLGVLVAGDGRLDDRQVVPAAFLREATTPATPFNAAHGLLWWLNAEGVVADTNDVVRAGDPPTGGRTGRFVDDAPGSLVWARGAGDQILQVDPATGTVLVRLSGDEPVPGAPFGAAQASRLVTDGVTGPPAWR
jgi:CubicO group peptidase (beta-lactamase class C family)